MARPSYRALWPCWPEEEAGGCRRPPVSGEPCRSLHSRDTAHLLRASQDQAGFQGRKGSWRVRKPGVCVGAQRIGGAPACLPFWSGTLDEAPFTPHSPPFSLRARKGLLQASHSSHPPQPARAHRQLSSDGENRRGRDSYPPHHHGTGRDLWGHQPSVTRVLPLRASAGCCGVGPRVGGVEGPCPRRRRARRE